MKRITELKVMYVNGMHCSSGTLGDVVCLTDSEGDRINRFSALRKVWGATTACSLLVLLLPSKQHFRKDRLVRPRITPACCLHSTPSAHFSYPLQLRTRSPSENCLVIIRTSALGTSTASFSSPPSPCHRLSPTKTAVFPSLGIQDVRLFRPERSASPAGTLEY